MYLSKSEIHQLDLLKTKTPSERFSLMGQLINGQFEAMKSGIRHQHPNASDKELKQLFKEKMFKIYLLKDTYQNGVKNSTSNTSGTK